MSNPPAFTTIPFSRYRIGTLDFLVVTSRRAIIHGLIEVDMTHALDLIHDYEARTGDDISVVAYIAHCLGKAIDENKAIQAFRVGSKLIIYDDVDVNIMIEREANGEKVVAQHVLRQTNRRGVLALCDDIREAQHAPVDKTRSLGLLRLYGRFPTFIRHLIVRSIQRNTHLWKHMGGTTAITSVGMFGEGSGWGLPVSPVSIMLTLGGMEQKPHVVDGRIGVRDMLCITLSFDHAITDGAPAARFTTRLKQLIESGSGLDACQPVVEAAIRQDAEGVSVVGA